jgi:hypothetical protein
MLGHLCPPTHLHALISPAGGVIEGLEQSRPNLLAGAKSGLQVPASLELGVVTLPVQAGEDSYELTVVQDEAALGVVTVDEDGNGLKRDGGPHG